MATPRQQTRGNAPVNNLASKIGNMSLGGVANSNQQIPNTFGKQFVPFRPMNASQTGYSQRVNAQRYPMGPPSQSGYSHYTNNQRYPMGPPSHSKQQGNMNSNRVGNNAQNQPSPPNCSMQLNSQAAPSNTGTYVKKEFDVALQMWSQGQEQAVSRLSNTSVSTYKPSYGNSKTNMHHSLIKIGQILWGPWVVPSQDPNAISKDDPNSLNNFAFNKSVGPMCGKGKPMIVSGVYKTHLVCYPIHTSGGAGLENKLDYQKSLCLPVIGYHEEVPKGVGLNYLRANENFEVLPNSYVDMTRDYIVELSSPIRINGALTDPSNLRLRGFVIPYIQMGWIKFKDSAPPPRPVLKDFGNGLKSPKLK